MALPWHSLGRLCRQFTGSRGKEAEPPVEHYLAEPSNEGDEEVMREMRVSFS